MSLKRSHPTPLPSLAIPASSSSSTLDAAVAFEAANVHAVYAAIASHFSATRYKPWPLVAEFLDSFADAPGSVGADLGCGNGKYLSCRSVFSQESVGDGNGVVTIGSDRSEPLVDLALYNQGSSHLPTGPTASSSEQQQQKRRNEVAIADALASGLRSRSVDYAISIAAIHHFSTHARRMEAVREMIRILRPTSSRRWSQKCTEDATPSDAAAAAETGRAREGKQTRDFGTGSGRFMIYAWAMEQRGQGRRAGQFDAEPLPSQTGEAAVEEKPQDVLVPWVLSNNSGGSQKRTAKGKVQETDAVKDAQTEQSIPNPPPLQEQQQEEEQVYQRCESTSVHPPPGLHH